MFGRKVIRRVILIISFWQIVVVGSNNWQCNLKFELEAYCTHCLKRVK